MVDSKSKASTLVEKTKTAPKETKKKDGPSIFDKLTDPNNIQVLISRDSTRKERKGKSRSRCRA